MQIRYMSILVRDQEAALKFYTDVLGFKKVADISAGGYRWLTVSSPDGPEGVELVLEPAAFPPAQVYQKALFEANIPWTQFVTRDIQADYARMKKLGVVFRGEPQPAGPSTAVLFEDGSGNLINLVQLPMQP